MKKLSVIVPTYNEEHNIREALESVKWADEIIVVDSFSEDRTIALAEPYADRILQREYVNSANQKNWAIPQARHEWVLILDSDERVSPGLKEEIQEWLCRDEIPCDAFWIGRQNYFMGEKVRYSGWQGDAVVRFFRRDCCRYEPKHVHAEIETENLRIGKLENRLKHYSYRSFNHFLSKMRRYARWSAKDYLKKTPKVTWHHLFVKPAFRFFKHFVIQRGFLDGKVGFIISTLMAWGVYLRYLNILEMRNREERPATVKKPVLNKSS